MSGIEIAGLVFGVSPILIEAVKNYRTICDTFHTFRHYSREVRRIEKQVRVCQRVYLNECSLLLQGVVGDEKAHALLEDSEHSLWKSKELSDQLNKHLSESYATCKDIIKGISEILEEVDGSLKAFDIIASKKRKGEKLKATFVRLRDSVKITFRKEDYEKSLAMLRERNADFHLLRAQIEGFQQKRINSTISSLARKSLPAHYSSVQRASQTLHEALSDAWNCSSSEHVAHCAKLCIEAQAEGIVRLDLALSYEIQSQKNGTSTESDPSHDPFWIYVQSVRMENEPERQPEEGPVNGSATFRDLSKALNVDDQNTRDALVDAQFSLSQSPQVIPAKRRKVQFSDDCTAAQKLSTSEECSLSIRSGMGEIRDFCQHIKKTGHPSRPCGSNECIGYLETPKLFKHVFYSNMREGVEGVEGVAKKVHEEEIITLGQLVERSNLPAHSLDIVLKLKIAHRIATTVLQYHSTPWLSQEWRLKDFAFFGRQQAYNQALQTLHLTHYFQGKTEKTTSTSGVPTEISEYASAEEAMKFKYGVNNPVLFSLGIALLELAHQKPLETMAGTEDPIVAARKLAVSNHPLGMRYQRVVQQCLQCNFGMGTDLCKEELQIGVYADVICRLEEMIGSLSLD